MSWRSARAPHRRPQTRSRNQALNAFVHGVQGAMLVGAVLAFSAAMTAFFGLRHAPAVNPAHDAVAVEA